MLKFISKKNNYLLVIEDKKSGSILFENTFDLGGVTIYSKKLSSVGIQARYLIEKFIYEMEQLKSK